MDGPTFATARSALVVTVVVASELLSLPSGSLVVADTVAVFAIGPGAAYPDETR